MQDPFALLLRHHSVEEHAIGPVQELVVHDDGHAHLWDRTTWREGRLQTPREETGELLNSLVGDLTCIKPAVIHFFLLMPRFHFFIEFLLFGSEMMRIVEVVLACIDSI